MDAWAKDQNVSDTNFLTMMGDPSGALTSALGMTLNHPGPMSKLGYERCKRFAMYLVDGVIKYVAVAERGPKGEEDPAGDDFPESTLAPAMIEAIKEKNAKRQAEKDARARHFLDEEVKRLERERTQLRMAKQELEA